MTYHKTHYRHALHQKAACGTQSGFYQPVQITTEHERVTCIRCKRVIEIEAQAKVARERATWLKERGMV